MKLMMAGIVLILAAAVANAAGHGPEPMVAAGDQDVTNGIVSAEKVVAGENG